MCDFSDLFPGEVQNLKSTLDPNTASLTLAWERPSNCETAKDVTAYDIWFKPCTSLEREGYCKTTVKASATSVHLTRESGLKPLMNYQFEIRARNAGYDGNWSRISKYIGKSLYDLKPFCLTKGANVSFRLNFNFFLG